MIENINVPKNRIKVLDSKDKKFWKEIEKKLNVNILKEESSFSVAGDGLELNTAKKIIKAIARGFSPLRARRLFEEENDLEIIELKFSNKRNDIIRSRLIGTKGRAREKIEKFTRASMSVQGKTIALIGNWQQIENAKKAVQMIIDGCMHKTVYKFLEGLK